MNGQQLFVHGVVTTPDVVWWDNMSLKQYIAKNVQQTTSAVYAKLYKKIAKTDYAAIVQALKNN